MLVVDDAHWADPSSLEVLAFLSRRLRDRPVLLVLTWRSEEAPAAHPVRRILAAAVQEGLGASIPLERLDRDAVAELAEAAGAEPKLAARLYEETDGVPFFVLQYLDARPDADGDESLPPGVRGLVESRIAAASEVAGQVLAAAAVVGRPFDADLVREVSGRNEEETVASLEELMRRGLLVEVDASSYAFRHEQARRVAGDLTSSGRRRLLHRRAADALAARDRGGASAGAIARHLREAGRETEAAEWFRVAGVHARGLYANAEALAHFREALGLGHDDPATLHEEIGDLLTLGGEYSAALESYEAAAALAPAERLASIAHRTGLVHLRRGEWELADSSFAEALAALPDDAGVLEARLLADRSLTAHRRHDGEAQALAQRALELADAAGDRRALAQAHNILGILASGRGDHAEARSQLERSLELASEEGDPSARAAALNNLALDLRAEGRAGAGARADRGGARALRRRRRPPPRGGAGEQRSPISSTPRGAARRRWSTSSPRSRSSPRSGKAGRASRRSGSSSSGELGPHPDGDVRRLDGARRDAGELGDDRVRVDRVPQPRAEERDERVPVVARAVEAAVDEPLHAPPKRVEERRGRERRRAPPPPARRTAARVS